MIRLATSNGELLDPALAPSAEPESSLLDTVNMIKDQLLYLASATGERRLSRALVLAEIQNPDGSITTELYLAGGRAYPDPELLLLAETARAYALEGFNGFTPGRDPCSPYDGD